MWVGIVPAAGKAERFGGAKLLADVKGEPLLNHTLRSLLDAGVGRVIVVVPPADGQSDPAAALLGSVPLLSDARVVTETNPDPSRGMLSSIQAGLSGAVGELFLVLPGDMPFVKPGTVKAVVDAANETGTIVSPRYNGRRGHPIAVPGHLRAAILQAPATSTLAKVLEPESATRIDIDVEDAGILRDVDEASDLQ
jgi:molybdenum cofactor cytidylyltransferase